MADSFFDMRAKLIRPARAARPPQPTGDPLTVSAVTKLVESAVRRGMPPAVLVRGEVSNFNFNRASGHAYFALKDSGALLNCVMFASEFSQLKFQPEHGMELIAGGAIKVFAGQGKYQLYVNTLQPVGHGALELAFRQLRDKLAAEGLFAASRKKPLPAYPMRIAMVSSREAAALADMLKVLARFPWITLGLFHAAVQGEGSGAALATAIELLGRVGPSMGYDLILLARGGGSLEDLWGFNDERLARAIANSMLPVITGIGHEVDVSIADLVADHHAHTPTEAATVAVRQWIAAPDSLNAMRDRLHRCARTTITDARHRLTAIQRNDIFRRPTDRLNDLRQRLDHHEQSLLLLLHQRLRAFDRRLRHTSDRLERNAPAQQLWHRRQQLQRIHDRLFVAIQKQQRRRLDRLIANEHRLAIRGPHSMLDRQQQQLNTIVLRLERAQKVSHKQSHQLLDSLGARLESLSPNSVLRRGYSMTRLKKSGQIVRSPQQVSPGTHLLTRVTDGEIESIAEDPRQPRLFE